MARVTGEEQQQVELALGERDLHAADQHPPGVGSTAMPLTHRRPLVRRGVEPPQHGVDARDELVGEQGLTM